MTPTPPVDLLATLAGQVSLPPSSDPLVRNVLRAIGLVVGAFLASSVAALLYRWYTREVIPRALAVLFGASVVALYLNTVGLFGDFLTGTEPEVFHLDTVLFNTSALAGAVLASPVGRIAGDRVATDVFAVTGAKELDVDVSRLVRTVGRVTTVTLPEDVGDIEGYDPAPESVKSQLSGSTLLFPRRLSEAELRTRLADRLKDDYGVGHVDVDLDGRDVSYLALGSRAAGLGPTLSPGTVALAIRADPGPGAAAGDPVQVWATPAAPETTDPPADGGATGQSDGAPTNHADGGSAGQTDGGAATQTDAEAATQTDAGSAKQSGNGHSGSSPTRVAFGELRGVADDVATVALDEEDAERVTGAESYRLVTLPADPRVDREFASLLRNADETMAVITVQPDASLDGAVVSDVDTTVVAIRPSSGSVDAIPARTTELRAGDTLYVVGRPEVLRRVERRATAGDDRTDGGDDGHGDGGGRDDDGDGDSSSTDRDGGGGRDVASDRERAPADSGATTRSGAQSS